MPREVKIIEKKNEKAWTLVSILNSAPSVYVTEEQFAIAYLIQEVTKERYEYTNS